jgi:hypothetical protein
VEGRMIKLKRNSSRRRRKEKTGRGNIMGKKEGACRKNKLDLRCM